MVRILIALAVVALCVSDASAFGRRNRQCSQTTSGVAVYRPIATCVTGSPQYAFLPTPQFPIVRQVFGSCANGSCQSVNSVTLSGPTVVPAPSK